MTDQVKEEISAIDIVEPITNSQDNRVEGNSQVVDLFTRWLEFARRGDLRFGAVVGCRTSEDVLTDCAGAQGTEFAASFGLDELKRTIAEHLRNRSVPVKQHTANADANTWIYSVAQWTVGYDFYQWLLNVAIMHLREGRKIEDLRIHFYPGQDGKWEKALNNIPRKQMFDKVCKPMVPLLGAQVTEDSNGRFLDHLNAFSYFPAVAAHREGIKLPKFSAPEWAREKVKERFGDRRPVVITLRETELHAYRNSNLPEWLKFAQWLKDQGEDVVFVRDTEKGAEPMEGWETYPEASYELELRMAIYEIAKCTFFGSNGPFGLVTVSDIPWICIYPLDTSKSYKYNNVDVWEKTFGVKAGQQFPWAKPSQKIVLKYDTFENIRDAWLSVADHLS